MNNGDILERVVNYQNGLMVVKKYKTNKNLVVLEGFFNKADFKIDIQYNDFNVSSITLLNTHNNKVKTIEQVKHSDLMKVIDEATAA